MPKNKQIQTNYNQKKPYTENMDNLKNKAIYRLSKARL